MNRRKFISALTSGVSSAVALTLPAAALIETWPDFVRSAFAGPSEGAAHADDGSAGLAVVSDGFRRATRAGKPLLLFIIPQDDSAKWTRGCSFGAWLTHGSTEELWPLALCEVACARMDDLRRLVPTVGLGEPLMVLVETDTVPTTVTRLDARLPEPDAQRRATSVQSWREQEQQEDLLIDRQTATLARLARKALAEGDTTLARRAAQVRAALPTPVLNQLDQLSLLSQLTGSAAPTELIDRGAAVLLAAPLPPGGRRHGRVAALAAAARARLSKQRVPGSHWAQSHGCGQTIEGHEDVGVGIMCGMGYVPAKSSRFLYFYTLSKDPKKNRTLL